MLGFGVVVDGLVLDGGFEVTAFMNRVVFFSVPKDFRFISLFLVLARDSSSERSLLLVFYTTPTVGEININGSTYHCKMRRTICSM